jgi:hypothetical protein
MEEPAVLPWTVDARPLPAGEADPVGSLRSFDLDDVGPHGGEEVRDERPGHERRELDDPHAGQRELGLPRRRRRRLRPRAGVGPGLGQHRTGVLAG